MDMFSPEILSNFWTSIEVMIKGMGGIFVFMFVFFMIIQLIDKLFPKKAENESNNK
ncbi:MAG: OadG-related small transporter subunit [Ignavibacteria bacterium]|jgi:Na+-transporting methylmalonyl-CoA/oxaloacetate decarboxylase gamma subunit|nr:OadG-related small transporter subunit [Ignavibacteria bacterium]